MQIILDREETKQAIGCFLKDMNVEFDDIEVVIGKQSTSVNIIKGDGKRADMLIPDDIVHDDNSEPETDSSESDKEDDENESDMVFGQAFGS